MALDQTQQDRADEIRAKLYDPSSALGAADRAALANELSELLTSDAEPAGPLVTEQTPALAARADRLIRGLYVYNWTGPDRALLARALAETTEQLPEGAWSPPALPAAAPSRSALLPVGLSTKRGDGALPAAERSSALADLDRVLDGLGADPAGAGAG